MINIERIKSAYKPGTKVRLIQMNDDPRPIPPMTKGTVECVDDMGTIHCVFENGRSLGIIPGVDEFEKL